MTVAQPNESFGRSAGPTTIYLIIILVVLVTGFAIPMISSPDYQWDPLLLFSSTTIAVALLLWRHSTRGSFRPSLLAFAIYYFVAVGVAGSLQLSFGATPDYVDPFGRRDFFDRPSFQTAIAVHFIFFAAAAASYLVRSPSQSRVFARSPAGAEVVRSRTRGVLLLLRLSMFVSVLGFATLSTLGSGAGYLLAARTERGEFLSSRSALADLADAFLLAGAALALICVVWLSVTISPSHRILNRPPTARTVSLPEVLFVLLWATLVTNPYSSSRAWLAAVVGGCICAAYIARGAKSFRLVAHYSGLLLLMALLAFPALDAFRTGEYRIDTAGAFGTVDSFLSNGDYDSVANTSAVIRIAEEDGHSAGRQLGGSLLAFVPREFWPAKPTSTGDLLRDRAGLRFGNVSAPVAAESYLDFGLAGVVIVAAFFGRIMKAVDASVTRSSIGTLPPAKGLILGFIASYTPLILRGPSLSVAVRVLPFLLIWGLWAGISRSDRDGSAVEGDSARTRYKAD